MDAAREFLRRPPFLPESRPDAVLDRASDALRSARYGVGEFPAHRCVGPAPRTHDADAEPVQGLLAQLSCGPLPRAILQWSGVGSTSLPPTQGPKSRREASQRWPDVEWSSGLSSSIISRGCWRGSDRCRPRSGQKPGRSDAMAGRSATTAEARLKSGNGRSLYADFGAVLL